MRFISFASNIGPAAAVPAGPAPSPLITATWIAYRGELDSPMGGATTFLCASVPRIEGTPQELITYSRPRVHHDNGMSLCRLGWSTRWDRVCVVGFNALRRMADSAEIPGCYSIH